MNTLNEFNDNEDVRYSESLDSDSSRDFAACFSRHYKRLVKSLTLAGLTRDEAADVAQDAFVVTLRNWWRVKLGANPGGYPYRVAFKSLKKRRSIQFDEFEEDVYVPARDVVTKIAIAEAMGRLPTQRRYVAVMSFVLGYSTEQIAHTFGISQSTVRKHIEFARRDLKLWLPED